MEYLEEPFGYAGHVPICCARRKGTVVLDATMVLAMLIAAPRAAQGVPGFARAQAHPVTKPSPLSLLMTLIRDAFSRLMKSADAFSMASMFFGEQSSMSSETENPGPDSGAWYR